MVAETIESIADNWPLIFIGMPFIGLGALIFYQSHYKPLKPTIDQYRERSGKGLVSSYFNAVLSKKSKRR